MAAPAFRATGLWDVDEVTLKAGPPHKWRVNVVGRDCYAKRRRTDYLQSTQDVAMPHAEAELQSLSESVREFSLSLLREKRLTHSLEIDSINVFGDGPKRVLLFSRVRYQFITHSLRDSVP